METTWCDLCPNESMAPCVQHRHALVCPKCEEFLLDREAMTAAQLEREAESIREYQRLTKDEI